MTKVFSQPQVGIVILSYNMKGEVSALISSILLQSHNNYRVLIVDNGSSDGLEISDFTEVCSLMKLSENCGVAAGFNAGIRQLLNDGDFEYIWLLDSDLTLDIDALSQMVKVMEQDEGIGIAGSIILNNQNTKYVVESGADYRLSSGIAAPLYCNEPVTAFKEILDVDYVGSGISLLRCEMIKRIGVLDERYFFLGEEVDYGMRARNNNYKVVAVTTSMVYHPPFTEKRSPEIYAYYGVRNPLLTVTKHALPSDLSIFIYRHLRRFLRVMYLKQLVGLKRHSHLTRKGIVDFLSGRFGKFDMEKSMESSRALTAANIEGVRHFFVIASGRKEVVADVIDYLRANSHANITLIVQQYRKHLLESVSPDEWILYDDRSSSLFLDYWRIITKLSKNGAVTVETDYACGNVISFFSLKTLSWDSQSKSVYLSSRNLFFFWKPLLALVLGEITSLLIFPFIFARAAYIRSHASKKAC